MAGATEPPEESSTQEGEAFTIPPAGLPGAAGTAPDTQASEVNPAPPLSVPVPVPVNVRSVALAVLAALACIYTLHWAKAVLVPVMVGLLLSYALSPVVTWMERFRLPRAASAGLLLSALFVGAGGLAFSLSDDANALVDSLPAAIEKFKRSVRQAKAGQPTPLATVQKAATQLEQVAEESTPTKPAVRGVQRVVIEQPRFDLRQHLWTGTLGLLTVLGQMCMMALIAFFLLASGDTFRRKLVKLAGPTLGRKKLTLEALNEINDQIQRYMLVQLFLSVLVGVVTWLCFLWVGLEHAAVWGVGAAVLNLVPYLGNVLIGGGSALVGFLQFGTLEMAAMVAAISVVINVAEGFFLMPWLTGRASRMNPVAVFIGVLVFGWLWGAWGLLLAVPMLVILKAICDRVDDLNAVGEILGT